MFPPQVFAGADGGAVDRFGIDGFDGVKQGNVSKHLGVLVSGSAVGFEMTERNVPASRAVRHRPAGYE